MKTHKWKVAALALVMVMPTLANAMQNSGQTTTGELPNQMPPTGAESQCWKQHKAQAEAQANRQSSDSSGNDSHSGSAG